MSNRIVTRHKDVAMRQTIRADIASQALQQLSSAHDDLQKDFNKLLHLMMDEQHDHAISIEVIRLLVSHKEATESALVTATNRINALEAEVDRLTNLVVEAKETIEGVNDDQATSEQNS